MSESGRVLLAGGKEKALAVARSLGEKGMEVDIVASELDYRPAFYSRYVSSTYVAPEEKESYLKFLEKQVKEKEYDLLIPLEINKFGEIVSDLEELQTYTETAVPPEDAYEIVHDKVRTEKACEKAGVPTPETDIYRVSDLGDTPPRKPPFVFKLPDSDGGEGVRRVDTDDEWKDILEEFKSRYDREKVLVQEFVEGKTVLTDVIVRDGELEVFSVEERVHELDMGPSSYRRSIAENEELYRHTREILEEIGWEGPAQIEFRSDGENLRLIEINGRFWGSLTVSIHAGIDFPYLLYQLYTGKKIHGEELEYDENIFSRNLVREAEWLLENLSGGQVIFDRDWGNSLRRVFRGKEHLDELTFRDPVPGLYTFLYMLETVSERLFYR